MLNPDDRDILSAFSDEKVEYLLVDAYALAAHGFVRATGDIDLWARPSAENAGRVMRALARFRAPLSEVSVADFREAWRDRKEIDVDGLPVHVISRLHLAKSKESVGRPQDRVDLEWLRGQDDEDEQGE